MGAPDLDKQAVDQKLLILAEFYIKKGQYPIAKEFLAKLRQPFLTHHSLFLFGKTEFKLKNLQLSASYLERGRELNPLHKPTLLLLFIVYQKLDKAVKAFECMVDLFLLSKEIKDKHVARYKKKVRELAQSITPPIDQKQKNELVKNRNLHLRRILGILEEQTLKAAEVMSAPIEDDAIQLEFANLDGQSVELPPLPPNILTVNQPSVEPSTQENAPPSEIPPEDTLTINTDSIFDEEEAFRKEATQDISGAELIRDHMQAERDYMALPDTNPQISRVNTIDEVFYESEETEIAADITSFSKPVQLSSPSFAKHLVFRTLDQAAIEKIEKFAFEHSILAGHSIHNPLDIVNGFSCLLSGRVQIIHQGKSLLELEAGSIIDEAELYIGSKYFFETKAIEDSKIITVDKASFLSLCKRQHDIANHFLWHFYKSLGLKINSMIDRIITSGIDDEILWNMDLLQETSQHRQVTALERHILEQRFITKTYNKNEYVYRNQSVATSFYILLDGKVEISHPESGEKIEIKPLEYFSEISLVSNSYEHVVNAKVESESATILCVDRDQLTQVSDQAPGDQYRVVEMLWKILSWKYFEFLNFYFHYGHPDRKKLDQAPINPFVRI